MEFDGKSATRQLSPIVFEEHVVFKKGPFPDVKAFGARGDGVTDDTVAVHAARDAAGVGGKLYFPPGTYRGAFVPLNRQVWEGVGFNASILKAKTAASEAALVEGLTHNEFRNLGFDGNAKASKGVVLKGSASVGSQGHLFSKCRFQNCTTGLSVEQGTTQQVDKNTYLSCAFQDNTTGARINSVNAQEQLFLGCTFDTATTGVQFTDGTVTMLSGQFQTCTTGVLLDGPGEWLNLKDVIFEGSSIDIDGATAWPVQGVLLEHCILEASTATVRQGVGTVLHARYCLFNNGNINVSANDCMFIDEFCTFALGAAFNPTGVNDRRVKWGLNGLEINNVAGVATLKFGAAGAAAMDTNLYRSAADTLKTDDKMHIVGETEIDGVLNHDGSTVGLFGATPVTQRAANADTSGATLAALETEVNELKQLLRDYGLLAT